MSTTQSELLSWLRSSRDMPSSFVARRQSIAEEVEAGRLVPTSSEIRSLADDLYNAAMYGLVIELTGAALKDSKARSGDDRSGQVSLLAIQSEALADQGELADALARCREALAMAASEPSDLPATLALLNNEAEILRRGGHVQEAVVALEAVLGDACAVVDPDTSLCEAITNNLAIAYLDAGRGDDALALLETLSYDRRHRLGIGHLDSILAEANLANALYRTGDISSAVRVASAALTSAQASLGESNLTTLKLAHNVGGLMLLVGQHELGVRLLSSTLRMMRAALGSEHPLVLEAAQGLDRAESKLSGDCAGR